MVSRYQKRISGPLLDRIDIHIEVPRVEYDKLSDERLGEPSAAIQARVEAARERQRGCFEGTGLMANADMGPAPSKLDSRWSEVRTYCQVDDAGRTLLRAAMQQLQMSARAYHRILKLSRPIADPSRDSGQAWRGVRGSKRHTWRRRYSTGRGGRCEGQGGSRKGGKGVGLAGPLAGRPKRPAFCSEAGSVLQLV